MLHLTLSFPRGEGHPQNKGLREGPDKKRLIKMSGVIIYNKYYLSNPTSASYPMENERLLNSQWPMDRREETKSDYKLVLPNGYFFNFMAFPVNTCPYYIVDLHK